MSEHRNLDPRALFPGFPEHRGNKTRFARRRVYTVSAWLGFCSLNAMKCVYVGFSLSKQRSSFRKIPLLYTGRAGGSARGKGFNNIFFTIPSGCSKWPNGNDMGRRVEGPEFACSLYFSFSFRLVFFLVIAVLFCFFVLLKFLDS